VQAIQRAKEALPSMTKHYRNDGLARFTALTPLEFKDESGSTEPDPVKAIGGIAGRDHGQEWTVSAPS